ncbi:MAG TPA: hypothetical protein VGC65_00715 [Bacteroidia bacterium]|jgi:hypothetical protein
MKNLSILFSALLLSFLSLNLSADNELRLNSLPDKNHPFTLKPQAASDDEGVKGKILITAGIGLNFLGTSLELRYLTSPYYDFSDVITGHQASPMYNAAIDYGLGKQVSVGVAFGYQTVRINMQDVGSPNANYHDDWVRIHLAARGDYYIIANEEVSLYTGAKLGYNLFTVSTTIPKSMEPNYLENLGVYPNPISAQAHFGFSYFVKGIAGFNAEFGIGYGGPYILAVGATIKI